MCCQLICPVNKTQIKKVAEGPAFSEKETGLLLQKVPFDKLAEETREKLISISANDWYEVLTRNLSVLMKNYHTKG
jgi:epoxyqueuosine reductase